MIRVAGIIPARLESTRLKRKLLLNETGKPLIQHVYERAQEADELEKVFVATDSDEIEQCVLDFGGLVLKTGPALSGTDRLAQACSLPDGEFATGVVNVQGDEPEISVKTINAVAKSLKNKDAEMVTAVVWETQLDLMEDTSIVKAVLNQNHYALYFSRSSIPYFRDEQGDGFYRHLGIYGYSRNFLLKYAALKQTPLEKYEKLEQLRAVENGFPIKVLISEDSYWGIDTPEDYNQFVTRFQKGN